MMPSPRQARGGAAAWRAGRLFSGLGPLAPGACASVWRRFTGSATASNVLFTSLQAQAAQALGLAVTWVVAAQNCGAAVGNIVCPHNIVAGAATVQATGREAEIPRGTLLPCAACLLLGGGLLALVLPFAAAGQ